MRQEKVGEDRPLNHTEAEDELAESMIERAIRGRARRLASRQRSSRANSGWGYRDFYLRGDFSSDAAFDPDLSDKLL